MKKHKNKIIAGIVIVTLLVGAWFIGGDFPANPVGNENEQIAQAAITNDGELGEIAGNAVSYDVAADPSESDFTSDISVEKIEALLTDYEDIDYDDNASDEYPWEPALDIQDAENDAEVLEQADTQQSAQTETTQAEQTDQPKTPVETVHSDPKQESIPPVVEDERPTPTEPQDATITDDVFTVYLTVRVDNILRNMHRLNLEKHELVPADGIIFPLTAVTAHEGESVFNVLQREMRRNRIHMESRFTPIFNSAYVMGINNLYEFDVGELSGWMYKVNGWFPNFGSSLYILSPGDVIEWHFTVDLGRDLGEFSLGGRQRDE